MTEEKKQPGATAGPSDRDGGADGSHAAGDGSASGTGSASSPGSATGSAAASGTPPFGDAASPDALQSGEGAPGDLSLDAQLAQATAQAAEWQEAYLRARAEMDNVRRRAQDEVSKAHKFAVESFAAEMLPVLDSLEAALKTDTGVSADAMRSGVELTLRQLVHAFEKNKLLAIDPAGERFDPHRHQAISMVPSDAVPAQHVVATLQKGWTIAERVLRPALVTVSQGPAG